MTKQGIITLLPNSCYRLIFMEGRVENLYLSEQSNKYHKLYTNPRNS